MGTHHNPPQEISEKGRRIYGIGYRTLCQQLARGERLYAVLDNGLYKAAPLIDSEKEYKEFDTAYGQGYWLSLEFYAYA